MNKNNPDYKHSIDIVIYLCSCAINKMPVDKNMISNINLDCVYDVAKKHMLSSIVGQILECNGISTPKFKKAVARSQQKAIILENDYKCIISEFEISGIWYMPLKGAVLKDLYPSFAMREMADIDIFFDLTRADDVREIMERLEFQVKSFGEKNDDDYLKPPVSNFEMHRYLFNYREEINLYDYYKNAKSTLMLKDPSNSFGYHLRAEDFYVYMIAHEYKHYKLAGTGLRSLLDTYVFLNSHHIDMNYIETESNKIGIAEFEKKNRSLAMNLYSGNVLSQDDLQMLDYILDSGTYGTYDQQVENSINKSGRKINYITRRILGPIKKEDPYSDHFKAKYSTFFKYPILLPFLPLFRLFNALRNDPKRIKREATAISKATIKGTCSKLDNNNHIQ